MKNFNKKILLTLIIAFVFSPFLAPRAQAQYIDIWNAVKDGALDMVGWQIPKMILQRMSASTVNWINSGFSGSPAYVTDPGAYFTNVGDQIASNFIFNKPELRFLCGPIAAKIRIALARSYVGSGGSSGQQWQCTLTEVGQNMEDFMGDFSRGGWDNFFELTQRQQNNPIGAYMMAEDAMNKQIATKVNTKLNELNQGSGFLSYEDCETFPTVPDITTGLDPNSQTSFVPGEEEVCRTVTPGSVIAGKLGDTLGKGEDSLVTADEINELVGALLNQLTSQVMGGVGGLLGASRSSGSSSNTDNSRSLIEQLASGNQGDTVTDYFGNTQQNNTPQTPNYTTVIIDNQVYMSSTDNTNVSMPYCLPEQADFAITDRFQCITPTDYDCVMGPGAIDLIKENRRLSTGTIFTRAALRSALLGRDCNPTGIHSQTGTITPPPPTTTTPPPPPPPSTSAIQMLGDNPETLNVSSGYYNDPGVIVLDVNGVEIPNAPVTVTFFDRVNNMPINSISLDFPGNYYVVYRYISSDTTPVETVVAREVRVMP
ncbi:MAG: hypothetical protein AAB446_00450 [Patescibacteria group bacterium]